MRWKYISKKTPLDVRRGIPLAIINNNNRAQLGVYAKHLIFIPKDREYFSGRCEPVILIS
jgi:hypothetical protein